MNYVSLCIIESAVFRNPFNIMFYLFLFVCKSSKIWECMGGSVG